MNYKIATTVDWILQGRKALLIYLSTAVVQDKVHFAEARILLPRRGLGSPVEVEVLEMDFLEVSKQIDGDAWV